MLYGRLDNLREQTSARLAQALHQTPGGTQQARGERDALVARYTDQLARYSAVENGLCFGRLDFLDGQRRHIGRLGIFDEAADYEPLLTDWRAPAARPFYLATAASPDGVRRRRHIRSTHRSVVDLDDEVLDLRTVDRSRRDGLTGEAALLAAVNASRTGRMGDIVETIQAEQDAIIRAGHEGVLVVQGGPGTGKTAVALHRAAFLLYTHRRQLAATGVLVIGPNSTFLRYIGQVLPSLGETSVVLSTIGDLYPGVRARRAEPPEVAAIKGRPEMAEVIRAAVADRQEVPEDVMEIAFGEDVLRLDRRTCEGARDRARRSRRPHNQARQIFVSGVIDVLARQVAELIGTDPYAFDPLGGDDAPGVENLLGEADLEDIRQELRSAAEVDDALDRLWPALTPQRLLADLFRAPERLAVAAPGLTGAERDLLVRHPAGGWTPADVPLLDEAAHLLGEDDRMARALARRRHRAQVAYAQGVLDITRGSRPIDVEDEADPEILLATDLVDAGALAQRQDDEIGLTTAERAAADPNWAFGHVIVDEAQELSAMAWRMLMRRCPSRSATLVGDLAQTGDLAGTSSWQRVLEPYVADRWRLERLTVNYRMPAEIMAVAADVLAGLDPPMDPPWSVRETGVRPWRLAVPPETLGERLGELVLDELATLGDGRLAVLVPGGRLADLGSAVATAVPSAVVGDEPDLSSPVVVLAVRQAKGLEFDSVLVVEPAQIIAESHRGPNDLYVALTRATQRVGVVYSGQLPESLARLRPLEPATTVA